MGVGYNPKIVTNGLVLALDAGNTKSYSGSGTTWTDLSGNGNSGTLTNGPTFNSNNGGAIVFDGVDDYITAGDLGTLSTFTCEAFAKIVTMPAGFACYVTNVYPGTASKVNFALGHVNNPTTLSCGFYDGAWHYSPTYTPTTNTWYHVAGTYDGSQIKFYVNGNSQGTPTSYVGSPTTSNGGIRIGRRWDLADYFTGNIATVKVYNRALSANEIQQNFNATRGRFNI